MMGVLGMLMFIPLVATGYSLVKEDVNRRNRAKLQQKQEEDSEVAAPTEYKEDTLTAEKEVREIQGDFEQETTSEK
jgi:hypothetical protein